MSSNLSLALIGAVAAVFVAWPAWGRSRQLTFLAVLAPALTCAAVLVRSSGDYAAHELFWERTLAGGDPWAIRGSDGFSAHSYGPLFNLLAIPFALHPLAPKVLYALVWAATFAVLACRDRRIAFALVPLGLWSAAWGGHFDILVAICLLAALGDYRGGRDVSAGVWLGAGFLLKFIPLAVLPFLARDGRRLRWKLVSSALATSVVGYTFAFSMWGPTAPLRPLLFNSQRPSGMVSCFTFTRSVLGLDLDRWSVPAVAASLAALMAWSVARRPAPVPVALAALGLILAFYKFGGMHYSIMLALPLAWYATEDTDRMLRRATILYAGWASACPAIISILRRFPDSAWAPGLPLWRAFTWAAGLPSFLITLALVAVLLHRAQEVTR